MAGSVTLFTFGYAYLYESTFNAIALIFKSTAIDTLVKIFQIIGGLLAIASIKKSRSITPMATWLMTVVIATTLMLSGNVQVKIEDKINEVSDVRIIDNVPYGLALFASLTNNFGAALTFLFDETLHAPDDMAYSKTGFLMNSRLVSSLRDYKITNPRINANFQNYTTQCIFYDILLDRYTIEDLISSSNLMNFMKRTASKSRGHIYHGNDGTESIKTCHESIKEIADDLSNSLKNGGSEFDGILAYARNLFKYDRNIINTSLKETLIRSLPISFSALADVNQGSGEELIRQAMIANGIVDGAKSFAMQTNSSSALMNAIAFEKARRQKSLSNKLIANLGLEYLPMARPLFECAIYFMYVFVAFICLFPTGASAIAFYTRLLIWIQLWNPIYAVFNMFANVAARHATQAKLMGATSLTISNQYAIANMNENIASFAAYIAVAGTFYISFYIVTRSEQLAPYLANLFTQDIQAPVHAVTSEMGSSNLSIGNTNFASNSLYNSSYHNYHASSSFSSGHINQQLAGGSMHLRTLQGENVLNTSGALSNLPVQANLSDAINKTYSEQIEHRKQLIQTQAHNYHQALSDTMNKLHRVEDYYNKQHSVGESDSLSKLGGFHHSKASTSSHQKTHSQAHSHGYENKYGNNINIGFSTDKLPIFVKAGADLYQSANMHKRGEHSMILSQTEASDLQSRIESLLNVNSNQHANESDDYGSRLQKDLSKTYGKLQSVAHDLNTSLSDFQSLNEHTSWASSHSQSISSNYQQPFYDYLQEHGLSESKISDYSQSNPEKLAELASSFAHERFNEIDKHVGSYTSITSQYKQAETIYHKKAQDIDTKHPNIELDLMNQVRKASDRYSEYERAVEATHRANASEMDGGQG